jgi:hypothetical protein
MEVGSLRRQKCRTRSYDFELVGGMATNGSDDDVEIV